MSSWVLCGIGIDSDSGRCGGGGSIAGGPPASPRSRESGAAIASSRSARSTSPVAARMSPSGPTCASWNETMSARRIRRTRASPPFGSRPYGWSFGNTRRDSARNARARVSSASMRRSFRSSPRTRSISFGGKVGWERHSTRLRTRSAAVARVRRPGNDRSSSPLWNSRVAPIPSRRSASFAALIRRVPLKRSWDVNSATPWSGPSAATPAGTLPRKAMNGFEARRTTRGRRRSRGRSGPGGSRRDLPGVEPHDGAVLVDEVLAGDRPDLLGADLLDLREERRAEVPRAEAFPRGEEDPLERDAVLFVPGPGADLLAGARELRLRRRGLPERLDLPVEDGFDAVERGPAGQGDARNEQRRIEFHLLPHADVRREACVDERPVQAVRARAPIARRERYDAAPTAQERRTEDGRRGVLGPRRGDVPSRRQEVGRARALQVAATLAVLFRLRQAERVRRGLRLQGRERLSDALHRHGRIEAADQDQGRVVRRVVPQVVPVEGLPVQRREVLLVADRRPVVRVDVERETPQLLLDGEVRLVLRSFALADDDRPLSLDLFRVKRGVPHALGLDHEGRVHRARGDRLEVHRVIRVGEGVHLAAEAGDHLVDVPLAELAAALEQHVLDPVGGAGHARDLVAGTDAVHDPGREGLRVRDRPEDDLQAVVQRLHAGGHPVRRQARGRYQVARRIAGGVDRDDCIPPGTQGWPGNYSKVVPPGPRLFRSLICLRRRSRYLTTLAGRAANARPLRPCLVVCLWRMNSLRMSACLTLTRRCGSTRRRSDSIIPSVP